MSKISVKDFPNLDAYGYFESHQVWPAGSGIAKQLEAADYACMRATQTAKSAAKMDMFGDKKQAKEGRKSAAKWALAANVLIHVINTQYDEDGLPDEGKGNVIREFLGELK